MASINLPNFAILGIVFIVIATITIFLMVKFDFLFKGVKKWFFSIALGLGIIAFSIKIVMIVLFSSSSSLFETLSIESNKQLAPEHIVVDPFGTKIQQEKYVWEALPKVAPAPDNNLLTPVKVALGEKLFFEKRLSQDKTVSCGSCHFLNVEKGGGDGQVTSVGIFEQKGSRNAPTVLNAAFQRVLFWDGRAASLEEQAKGPLVNPVEMGMPSLNAVVTRLTTLPEYQTFFDDAFEERPSITSDTIVKAIASFERTLITPDTPYDRFVRGEEQALNKQQLRGMALFESTGCVQCHSGPNFSGASLFQEQTAFRLFPTFRNTTYEAKYKLAEDKGIVKDKSSPDAPGVWRVPSLRNISITAPYLHNGSVKDLKEVIRIMATMQLNKTISNNPLDDKRYYWSASQKRLLVEKDISLSEEDIDDIAAFLGTLTGAIPDEAKESMAMKGKR